MKTLHHFIVACGLGFIASAQAELHSSKNEATIGGIVGTAFMESNG